MCQQIQEQFSLDSIEAKLVECSKVRSGSENQFKSVFDAYVIELLKFYTQNKAVEDELKAKAQASEAE